MIVNIDFSMVANLLDVASGEFSIEKLLKKKRFRRYFFCQLNTLIIAQVHIFISKCKDLARLQANNRNIHLCKGSKPDRKSTRLNSSHVALSYAVLCLKKK